MMNVSSSKFKKKATALVNPSSTEYFKDYLYFDIGFKDKTKCLHKKLSLVELKAKLLELETPEILKQLNLITYGYYKHT